MPVSSSAFTHTSLEHIRAIPDVFDVFRGGMTKNA
jgi:hypothetical protein